MRHTTASNAFLNGLVAVANVEHGTPPSLIGVEQAYLRESLRELLHESEAVPRLTQNAVLRADAAKQLHEFLRARARQIIGVPVPLDLAFLYARKVIVGHRAKVFPATLVERAAAVEVHAAAPAARGEDSFASTKCIMYAPVVGFGLGKN